VIAVLAFGLAACSGRREPPAGGLEQAAAERVIITRTEHVYLYAPSASSTLHRQLARVLEASTRRFTAQVPGGSEPFIKVRLYESEYAWRQAVAERLPAGVHLGRGMSRGAVTIGGDSYLFDIGGSDALRLAAHEAWHAWAQLALSRLPVWLDEALATRAEGFYLPPGGGDVIFDSRANPTRRSHLRRLTGAGNLGSLEEYLGSDPAQLTDDARALDDFYARAWVFGLLLEDADLADRLSSALERAARGMLAGGSDAPLPVVLGVTGGDLDSRWRRLAHELVRQ
jgi:hypothetical protein